MAHIVPQNLLGNPGSDYIRDQVFSKRAPSGLLDAGGMSLDQVRALLPHPVRQERVQAGANITVTWNALGPVIASSGGALADGDYGDITVGGTGTTMTIDNDAVTYAKMQNVSATDRLLGRSTAGAGDVEEITCTAAGRALLDDANATAQRTTLGIALGDTQAWTAAHSWSGLTLRNRIISTTTQTSVGQSHGGLLLEAVTMNATNKYTAGLLFGSSDANFTTTNPKVLAGIVGYALEAYTADDDGYMGLEFFASPANPGVTPTPTSIGTAGTDGWNIALASAATAVTQSASDDSTKIATTAFVQDVAFATSAMAYVGGTTIAGAAATTIAVSGLDLDTHGRYEIEVDLFNPSVSSATLSLYVNADTTAGNYDLQALQLSNSTFSNSRVNAATFAVMAATAGNGRVVIRISLTRSALGYVTAHLEGSEDSTTTLKMRIAEWSWRTLATNVTQVVVSSSVASSIGIGSTLKVWKVTG